MRVGRVRIACMALLLAALTSGLVSLAYASPPDPSWIRGIYDDNDGDNVVGLIVAGVGLIHLAGPADLRPDIVPVTALTPIDAQRFATLHSCSLQPRAPPAA